jgi:hypothetical protein
VDLNDAPGVRNTIRDDPKEIARYGAFIEIMTFGVGVASVGFGAFLSQVGSNSLGYAFSVNLSVGAGTSLLLVGILLRVQRAIQARLEVANQVFLDQQEAIRKQLDEIQQRIYDLQRRNESNPGVVTPVTFATEDTSRPRNVVMSDWLAVRLIQSLRAFSNFIIRILQSLIQIFAWFHKALQPFMKWTKHWAVTSIFLKLSSRFFRNTIGRGLKTIALGFLRLKIRLSNKSTLKRISTIVAFLLIFIALVIAIVSVIKDLAEKSATHPRSTINRLDKEVNGFWGFDKLDVEPNTSYNNSPPNASWPGQTWRIRTISNCHHIRCATLTGISGYLTDGPNLVRLRQIHSVWIGTFSGYSYCTSTPQTYKGYKDYESLTIRNDSNRAIYITLTEMGFPTAAGLRHNCPLESGVTWAGTATRLIPKSN